MEIFTGNLQLKNIALNN